MGYNNTPILSFRREPQLHPALKNVYAATGEIYAELGETHDKDICSWKGSMAAAKACTWHYALHRFLRLPRKCLPVHNEAAAACEMTSEKRRHTGCKIISNFTGQQ